MSNKKTLLQRVGNLVITQGFMPWDALIVVVLNIDRDMEEVEEKRKQRQLKKEKKNATLA